MSIPVTHNPVINYLKCEKILEGGKAAFIPTGPHIGLTYRKAYEEEFGSPNITNRGANKYKDMLFSDEFERGNVNLSKGIFEVKHRLGSSNIIAGGIQNAFAPGKTVLELGSGEAFALLQFSIDFPRTTFIGVDSSYDKIVSIKTNKPGVQLTQDNWKTLSTIPDRSINTIISCKGAFTHGIHESNPEDSLKIINSLNRVVKEGAILRFDTDIDWPGDDNSNIYAANLLKQNGWQVYFANQGGTTVAIKA